MTKQNELEEAVQDTIRILEGIVCIKAITETMQEELPRMTIDALEFMIQPVAKHAMEILDTRHTALILKPESKGVRP